jgi:Fuc2NAc and GlcNAc transferase
MALCVTQFGMDGALGLIIAYIPLVILAIRFKAGTLEAN